MSDLLTYLLQNNLIIRHQHGLLTKHYTFTQLLEILNDWTLLLKTSFVSTLFTSTSQQLLTLFRTLNSLPNSLVTASLIVLEPFYLVVLKPLKLTKVYPLHHMLKVVYHMVVS